MNCTGYPSQYDEVPTEDPKMPMLINIQKKYKKGLVKTTTGKIFPVTLADWLIDGVQLNDYVDIEKSMVAGEWVVVDYHINFEVTAAIHNSYQEKYEDMIVDERGVPYGY